jgi:hypothetical protein
LKRDWLREAIRDSVEWYELAATSPPSHMYRQCQDECEPTEGSYPAITDSRPALRDMSIDMRSIVYGFLNELTEKHGCRRTERFIDWIGGGYLQRFGREHRCQIKEDKRKLKQLIVANYYGRRR